MDSYVHLSSDFPTEKEYIYYLNLNEEHEYLSGQSPYRALYFCNSKYTSCDEKYPSPWIKMIIEKDYILPSKKYTVTLKKEAKIYHIRNLEDIKQLQDKYGYNENELYCFHHKNRDNILKEIQEINQEIDIEMEKIRTESQEIDDDVYFKCSKRIVKKLYSRELDKIVFEPQFQISKRKIGDKTIPLKTPKIYDLMQTLAEKNKSLQEIIPHITQYETRHRKDKIDYNQMRRDGYHGIELHPEISEFMNGKDHQISFFNFFGWLSFPQLIIINWCIENVNEEPIDLTIYSKNHF